MLLLGVKGLISAVATLFIIYLHVSSDAQEKKNIMFNKSLTETDGDEYGGCRMRECHFIIKSPKWREREL
jgi:hypothetical protein